MAATQSEIVELLDGLTLIASRAAAAILAVPRLDLNRRDKADASPVTAADDASETVILAGLSRLLPGLPVVSEESTGNRPFAGLGDASSSSTRSTAPGNFSPRSTSSPSTSPSSRTKYRSPAWSERRPGP